MPARRMVLLNNSPERGKFNSLNENCNFYAREIRVKKSTGLELAIRRETILPKIHR